MEGDLFESVGLPSGCTVIATRFASLQPVAVGILALAGGYFRATTRRHNLMHMHRCAAPSRVAIGTLIPRT